MNRKKISDILLIVLCVVVISIPSALLLITGEAPHDLYGEKDYDRPSFILHDFISGQFQVDFENWFSTKFPLRPDIVALYGFLDAKKDRVQFTFHADPYTGIIPVVFSDAPFPAYALQEKAVDDTEGYKGTVQVVIGKNGYLFENGYINEYYGFSRKYTDVTDEQLSLTADRLKDIQTLLAARGIAFCIVITPSKASSLPQFIPQWYTMKYTAPPDYIRPYTRFAKMLEEKNIIFVDSSRVYQSRGLTNTFPKTGTHWNKIAAYETAVAVIAAYEQQTDSGIKRLAAESILQGDSPPGFGSSEQDILGVVYAGKKSEFEKAIIDDVYFWPDVYTANANLLSIPHVTIQGGSFTEDLIYYFNAFDIVSAVTSFRYNNNGDPNVNWEEEINRTKYILLEVNEQFVYNMGGNAPVWGQNDFIVSDAGFNIIDSLYEFLAD